jgi:pimeloyl-ACP methyl ester carboxylesterase
MPNKKEPTPALRAPNWMRQIFAVFELLSPYLTARLASLLFFTPIRFKAPKHELEFSRNSKTKTIKFKNNKVQFYEWGSAEKAILLVHGWAGRATQVAHLAAPLMKAGYKVYSFDAPAHGNSNGRHTHIMEFSDLIFRIKELHPEIESIIGHSMGGSACVYALTKGFVTKKCIIIGSPSSTKWILKAFCETINVSTTVEKLMRVRIEAKFQKQFDDLSISNMVKTIDTDGLILHCEDDVDAPVESAHQIHKNWKNSRLVLTKKLGHRRILKNKDVSQTIIDFLKS